MKVRMIKIVAMIGLMCPALWAQSQSWSPDNLPAALAGNGGRTSFSGDKASTNTLTTRVRVSAEVDDNALNTTANKTTDEITRLDPTLIWNLSRARWSVDTEYTPGFSYSLELPRYRSVSHSLTNSLNFRLAQHLNLRLRNTYRKTSDPFDQIAQSQTVPGFGVLDQINPTLQNRPTLYTSDQAGFDLTYAPAAHTTVGLSGNYATTMYEDLTTGLNFDRDTQIGGGRVFIDQKLSPRQSVSVSYSYQIIAAGVYGRTATQTVLLYDNWQLSHNVNFSVFGGPEYSDVTPGFLSSTIPLANGWSWSAGGTLGWSGAKTSITGSVVRRVSNGAGFGGAVEMTDFSGRVQRRLGKRWQAGFFTQYTMNGSGGFSSGGRSINFFSGGVNISREIVRNLSFDAKYWYSHQDQFSNIVPLGNIADHNRVSIGLSYSFSHRMGS